MSGIKTFELPANAPKTCPVCGGEWTRGYIVRKVPGGPGSRTKNVYKWALECRNDGCGLGYFAGSEIEYEETEGLELIDREKRKKEVVRMAEEKEDNGAEKGWGGAYERCRDCGTTEKEHRARGLCSTCYQKHYADGTLKDFPATASGRTAKPRKARAAGVRPAPRPRARARDDDYRVEVTVAVNFADLPPKVQQEVRAEVAEKLADKVLARLDRR